MELITKVTNEIVMSAPCFGLNILRYQAACLAALYVYQRADKPVDVVAEMMLNVPEILWAEDDEPETVRPSLRTLVGYLDEQYFVDTFEEAVG